jgi:hypothetical protein
MTVRPGAALSAAALFVLASCATPAPEAAPDAVPPPTFTAAPGDIMVLSDRCAAEICDTAAAATLPGVTELLYLGMRSPTEAVFQRRQVPDYEGPTMPSGVEGVVVPVRPAVEPDPAAGFIPARRAADAPAGASEIVVNPIAGAQFGVEDIAVTVSTIAPGRVIYTVERL